MNDYIVLITGLKVKIKYKEILCLNWVEAKKRALNKIGEWSKCGFPPIRYKKITVRKYREKRR